jgi:hypothetical protein
MKGSTQANFINRGLGFSILFMSLLGACAKSVTPTGTTNTPVTTTSTSGIVAKRQCTEVIHGATVGTISGFFGKVVRNLEGAPTYCLTVDNSSTKDLAKGTLRIEYEDDFGIRYYSIDTTGSYFGSLKQGTDGSIDLNIVWIDNGGFIEVKSHDSGNGTSDGSIKYYNFPSYQDALSAAMADAAKKCKDGTMTVAQCLGYNFPSTFWWNDPNYALSPQQQVINQAQAILDDATKTTTLGTIQFDIGAVMN